MRRHGQEPSVFRSDQIRTLAAKRASVVRAQDLDVPFLYYRSVAIRESRGRRDAVGLVGAFFTAREQISKRVGVTEVGSLGACREVESIVS